MRYTHYLLPPKGYSTTYSPDLYPRPDFTSHVSPLGKWYDRAGPTGSNLAILRSSRSVYEEVMAVLYSAVTFGFYLYVEPDAPTLIKTDIINCIMTVELHCPMLPYGGLCMEHRQAAEARLSLLRYSAPAGALSLFKGPNVHRNLAPIEFTFAESAEQLQQNHSITSPRGNQGTDRVPDCETQTFGDAILLLPACRANRRIGPHVDCFETMVEAVRWDWTTATRNERICRPYSWHRHYERTQS